MTPRKPKSTTRSLSEDTPAEWQWPPLEPGETEDMRKERIFQTLVPFIKALARDQARRDHEAEIASGRNTKPSGDEETREQDARSPVLGEIVRFPGGHYDVRGIVDGRYVVRVRHEARGTQKYEVWTEEELHQFDDVNARKRAALVAQADRVDRNQQIYERSLAGETMNSLVVEFGISTTRIRTIIAKQARKERGRP